MPTNPNPAGRPDERSHCSGEDCDQECADVTISRAVCLLWLEGEVFFRQEMPVKPLQKRRPPDVATGISAGGVEERATVEMFVGRTKNS